MRPEIVSLLLTLLAAGPAAAEWDALFWNPVPLDGDLALPMPCDGAMAFRRVDTPVQPNWLADEPIQLGNNDIAGQEHSESPMMESIVGGLARDGAAARYYLVAKYEVTRDQWDAVMSDTCPAPDEDGAIPADGMSWLDAQIFAARYTEWLYANGREALAEIAGEGAYLRLPTEEEWEFAARGGLAVTEAVRRQRLFPMDGPLEDYVWFSGFKSCDGLVQPVGILEPNPLGLFDILGNVQELTVDTYRMRTRERHHGQVGGIVARGGSCLTSENRVRSADRDEVTPADPETGRPAGKAYTGLRPVVGAVILADSEQITRINEDWRAAGEMRVQLDPAQDPVDALGVIAEAEDNPQIRDALLNAAEIFETEMARRNAIESRSARSVVQAGLLGVRDYIGGFDTGMHLAAAYAGDPENPDLAEALKRAEERLEISKNVLFGAIIHAAEDFEQVTFEGAVNIVAEENAARLADMSPRTRETTGRMLAMFSEFVAAYRERPDTDPETVIAAIKEYHRELTGR